MKNNDDKILRFLSELMDDEEKIKFEEELKISPKLSERMNSIKDKLKVFDSKTIATIDSNYFAQLIPQVRSRIEGNRKARFILKPAYITSIVSAITIAVIFLVTGNKNTNPFSFDDQENMISQAIDSADEQYLAEYINGEFAYSDINYDIYSTDENSIIDYFQNVNFNEIYHNEIESDFLNELTEQEVEDIYLSLNNENFL